MKRSCVAILFALVLGLMPYMPAEVSAAPVPDVYITEIAALSLAANKPCPRGTYKVRRNTRTKKKLVNSLIAGGIGTAIGAGIGGGRGALIGAGSGAGGYLVYRYVRDRRGKCVPRYVRG